MIQFGQVYSRVVIFIFLYIGPVGCLFALSVYNSQQSNVSEPFSAVCIVYHRFGDTRYPSTNTSVSDFESHIKYLKSQGFSFLTASQVNENADVSDHKQVVITVDDGYQSFYCKGLETIKKNNVTATLFINTESVGSKDYLTWEQIKEIADQGIEIGHHSHAHSHFINLSDSKRAQFFEDDLLTAASLFKKHLGFIPNVYSYPYGEFDQVMINVLKKHGYQLGFAQNSGVWNEQSEPFAIPRFPMAGEFVRLDQFQSKVTMKPLKWQSSEQLPLIVKAGEAISFNLKLANAELDQLNCFIAGQNRSDVFTKHGNVVDVLFKVPANRRRTLITFTARDKKGQWYWGSRLVINPEVKE